MIDIPAKCIVEINHQGPKLVCEENGRRVVFSKPRRKSAEKIRIDGCVLRQEPACDYLVRDWKDRHYFVELKDGHDEHALKQIAATIPHFFGATSKESFWCLVACSGSSPRSRPGLQTPLDECDDCDSDEPVHP